MASPNLSELITTTLRNRSSDIADNVTNKNALLTRLKEKGKIRTLSGGRTIVEPLTYAENSTFQYFNGYDVLNINPSDVISAAEFSWKNAAVNVSISGEEERQNSGSEAILNLLEARIQNAMDTMANNIATGLYSDGTGSGGKTIGGLQLLVADTPTTGSPGGINRATFTFWRNSTFDATTDGGGAASATNIQGYMNTVYNGLVRGVDAPDMIVADNNYFGFYQSSLQAQQRFADPTVGDSGFVTLRYAGADVILEGSAIPADHMYFLNTDYLGLTVHKDAFFTPQEDKRSINQDATVVPMLFMGNMTASNLSLQGVLTD
jgi:hypothetical protein